MIHRGFDIRIKGGSGQVLLCFAASIPGAARLGALQACAMLRRRVARATDRTTRIPRSRVPQLINEPQPQVKFTANIVARLVHAGRRPAASVPEPRAPGSPVASAPSAGASSPEAWRLDKEKYQDLHRLPGGRQPPRDFRMGPYAHTMRKDPETGKVYPVGRFFASPREEPAGLICIRLCTAIGTSNSRADPVTFVVNCLIALTTVWTISQLSWGESFFEKRKRVIRERIRQEYGLPKGWEHEIEEDGDLLLEEAAPESSAMEPKAV
eukprot:s5583_g1.t2